ncbi:MAG TPA: helix-hairpin-helix domain-containing protein [Candidatus Polarisedimenticolaceae bacterium]|nr:helix-hairpin-helix domain-containing protein [Candidatus Polarisedimenticolaceae bacterium]
MLVRSRLVVPLALAAALVLAAAPPAAAAPASSSKPASADVRPVDINAAGAAELQSVPGIGKALAERILAFREKNGAFGSVDDLLKVQGIGEKSLQKLRPYLTVTKAK